MPRAESLVDRAISWGIAPLVLRRIQPRTDVLPEAAAQRLTAASRFVAAATLRLTARAAVALAALLDVGIAAAGFKGVALVGRSGHMPRRAMGDVDVLVAEKDLSAALKTLAHVGFKLTIPGSLHDYRDFIRNAPHFSGNRAVPLADAEGHSLDLHWGFGTMCGPALHPDAILARSVVVDRFGQKIRIVSRTDALLLAAHHAMRENFTPAVAVKNLVDIEELACDAAGEVIDAGILAHAGTPAVALAASATILQPYLGERAKDLSSSLAEALSPAQRAQACDLATVFACQIDSPPLNRDVLHLMHITTLRELLQTALTHRQRNRGIMLALGGLPDRARLWQLVADLVRLRPADLRRYRSLARAKRSAARA